MLPHENEAGPSNVIRAAFDKKLKRNPRYSVRAFARELDVSPGFASLLLRGKKRISIKRAIEIGQKLGLSDRELRQLARTTLMSSIRTKFGEDWTRRMIDQPASRPQRDYETIPLNLFRLFSSWYYVAILDLATCEDFQSSNDWIASRLGISAEEAKMAVAALLQLGLLKKKGTKLQKSALRLHIPTEFSDIAIRLYHSQMIDKAKEQLKQTEDAAFKRRYITGSTMGIDPANLAAARELIDAFKKDMSELLTDGTATDVYQLNIQLFPLTLNPDQK